MGYLQLDLTKKIFKFSYFPKVLIISTAPSKKVREIQKLEGKCVTAYGSLSNNLFFHHLFFVSVPVSVLVSAFTVSLLHGNLSNGLPLCERLDGLLPNIKNLLGYSVLLEEN